MPSVVDTWRTSLGHALAYYERARGSLPGFVAKLFLFEEDSMAFVQRASQFLDFVPKSGRMLVVPILAGTFERNDGRTAQLFQAGGSERRALCHKCDAHPRKRPV